MPDLELLQQRMIHAPSTISAFLGSSIGLGGLVLGEELIRYHPEMFDVIGGNHALLFISSFGALATLLYGAPAAPLGRIKNTLCGHTVAIFIAYAVHVVLVGVFALPVNVEKVLTPSLAIGAMVHLQVIHPPAAACVLAYTTLEDPRQQGPIYILVPALVGALWMLAVQLVLAASLQLCSSGGAAPPAAAPAKQVRALLL